MTHEEDAATWRMKCELDNCRQELAHQTALADLFLAALCVEKLKHRLSELSAEAGDMPHEFLGVRMSITFWEKRYDEALAKVRAITKTQHSVRVSG